MRGMTISIRLRDELGGFTGRNSEVVEGRAEEGPLVAVFLHFKLCKDPIPFCVAPARRTGATRATRVGFKWR
jgi:hypothetical protein